MKRSQSRENAFMFVFEKQFNPEYSFDDMKALAEDAELLETDEFMQNLYEKTEENAEKVNALISEYSHGWKIERLSKVVVSILKLSICEILYFDDVPDSVSANEAVELAKKYATTDDASFINGILGSVIKGKSNQ